MTDVLIELDDRVVNLLKIKAEIRGCSFDEIILALLAEADRIGPDKADETGHPTL